MVLSRRGKQILTFSVVIYTLTAFSILAAYNSSKSFLQLTVKLTEGVNVLILTLFILLNLSLSWNFLTWLIFGELRLIEHEHIFERVPFTAINIIIMTSLFGNYQIFNVITFALCFLVLKIFHWILKDRLEQLLQSINFNTKLRHLFFSKYTRNLIFFGFIDYWLVKSLWINYFINNDGRDQNIKAVQFNYGLGEVELKLSTDVDHTDSISLLFGMEFCILFLDVLNLGTHTLLNFYEFYRTNRTNNEINLNSDNEDESDNEEDLESNGLEGKFIFEKILDLLTRFAKTAVHVMMLLKLQLVVIKDIFWDLMLIYQEIRSLWKIYQSNVELDDKLPNVQVFDLLDHENICIVCINNLVKIPHNKTTKPEEVTHSSEEITEPKLLLTQGDIDSLKKFKRPKKLPCGHMLHLSCLKNWLERSQTCPICRLSVFDESGNVKPSVVRPRNREHNIIPSNNVNQDIPLTSKTSLPFSNTENPAEIHRDPSELNKWFSFNIESDNLNTYEQEITFNAELIPDAASSEGAVSLKISSHDRVTDSDNNIVVSESMIRRN